MKLRVSVGHMIRLVLRELGIHRMLSHREVKIVWNTKDVKLSLSFSVQK